MKYLALVCLFFVLALPVFAQDATAEATAPVAAPTAVVGGVTVINNPVDTPVSTDTSSAGEPWLAKYAASLAALFIALGAAVGVANKWLETKKADPSFVTGTELAAGYTPDIVKKGLIAFVKQVIRFGGNLQEILDEATDGTPYVVKVHTPPTTVIPPDPTHPES